MACHVNVIECPTDKLDTTKDYVATFKLGMSISWGWSLLTGDVEQGYSL